ncbi:uncharacterized protein LOC123866399 isoform X5 [Maniola jurtina]|uniref:uncharacterized protein LOC123866399 isoform X5 n=1 Tax=Maniola jurtina TaxID=191418 RepID=UPI001E6885FD|nr:uncharacterized protein LOC123866399 isoform X5 [Maniola jurtina]
MYYSPILVLVLITILSLSGAYSERYPRDYQKSNYETPLNDERQDEVLDIANGNYRKNVILLEPGVFQRDTHNNPATRLRTYTTNIANGNHNHNIIDFGFDSGSKTDAPETREPNTSDGRPTQPDNNGFITQGSQQSPSSSVDDQLKKLQSLNEQLQQIASQLIQEIQTNTAQQ